MSPIKRLIHEIHRRSLWQVVAIYLVGSFGALQVVEFVTENAGLPDWVPPFALILMIVGLPIVGATAFIQEGLPGREAGGGVSRSDAAPGAGDRSGRDREPMAPGSPATASTPQPANLAAGTGSLDRRSTRPPLYKRVMTWRFALVGGVAAFALLGVAVAGYFVMRVTGIGPVASLQAQGVFDEREAIVVADFRNLSADSMLGDVVTEALRVDLVQSPVLRVVDPTEVAATLQRMELPADTALTAAVALEVAAREGFKAVLAGEVGSLGSGYVVTATLRSATDGHNLAAFRVTADDDSRLVRAIDKLSQDIREKAGESLRSIKADPPLARVTTSSLEALRKYAEADVIFDRGSNYGRALALLEDAVAADSGFAMAWRKIAVILRNRGTNRPRMIEAATRAWQHRDRLTEYERDQATAFYHLAVTGDDDEAIRAYESVLTIAPEDLTALNNLALIYFDQDRYAEAEDRIRQRMAGGAAASIEYGNLEETLIMEGKLDEARATLAEHRAEYPNPWTGAWNESLLELRAGNVEAAEAAARILIGLRGSTVRALGHRYLAYIDILYGHLREARKHWADNSDALAEVDGATGVLTAALGFAFHTAAAGIDGADAARLETLMAENDWRSIDPTARPYPYAIGTFALAGERGRVEQLIQEWEREVPADIRGADHEPLRRASLAVLDLVEGNAAAAAQGIEDARRGFRCTRCLRTDLAKAYEALGRTDDAIATWRSIVEERSSADDDPFEYPLALERLGALYDAQGDRENAIAFYSRFADLWADADPELQPRVEHAKNRVAALVAERG